MNSDTLAPLPLYSHVILSYNLEAFIGEALGSVLAQTYPNLEIVVSDDCSTDRTWEIIQEVVAQYQGPHKIVLNRNPHNLGTGWNSRKALELATGEVIVWSDGDDISLPQRDQRTYEAFRDQDPHTMLIWCRHEPIDAQGKSCGPSKHFERDVRKKARELSDIKRRVRLPFGAVIAMRREVVDTFNGLPENILIQDNILCFRALLIGKIGFIRDVLVQYRSHAHSFSNAPRKGDLAQVCRQRAASRDAWYIQAYAQHLVDIQYLGKKFPQRRPELLRVGRVMSKLIARWLVSYEVLSEFPLLSWKKIWHVLPYPDLYRHLFLALFYKLGLWKKK